MARLVCTVLCAFWLCACGTKAAKPVAARDAGAGTDGGGGPRSFSNLNQPHAISDAFMLAEGPVWDTCNKRLLFLDIATRKIHALDERLAVSDLVIGTNYAAGMAIGPKGEWLVAEMGSDTGGRVSSWQHAGRGMDTFTPLVEKDPAGKPLGTVCDLVSASDGTIYFTDPVFPHGPYTAYDAAARPIYRASPKSAGSAGYDLTKIASAAGPDGIELSPDERTLYVAAYAGGSVLRFDLADDGTVTSRGALISGLSKPDSMCLDTAGNLYIGVADALLIVDPSGNKLAQIALPTTKGVTNCAFGGAHGRVLYITTWTSLYQVTDMPVPGLDWTKQQALDCP